jgi:hypothetical protein
MTATPTAPCWTATPRRRRQPSLLRRARPVAPRMAASPAYPRSVLSAAAAFPATPCWAAAASPMSPMGASVAPRAAPVGFPSSQARLSHCPPPGKQTHRVTVLEQIPRGSRVVRAVCSLQRCWVEELLLAAEGRSGCGRSSSRCTACCFCYTRRGTSYAARRHPYSGLYNHRTNQFNIFAIGL